MTFILLYCSKTFPFQTFSAEDTLLTLSVKTNFSRGDENYRGRKILADENYSNFINFNLNFNLSFFKLISQLKKIRFILEIHGKVPVVKRMQYLS